MVEAFEQDLRVENPHDHFFAKSRRQGGEAQLDFHPGRGFGFEAAVLGFTFFGDVHPTQTFEAADNGHGDVRRELVNGVQHAVDAKTHATLFAARLDMDIAGPLFKGVLKQPVDDIHNVRVVGVGLLAGAAQR